MSPIDSALEDTRRFATAGAYRDAAMMAKRGLFDVTRLDPRVDPSAFVGLALGDAAVIRNAAGHVSEAVIRDVAFNGQVAERHVRMGRWSRWRWRGISPTGSRAGPRQHEAWAYEALGRGAIGWQRCLATVPLGTDELRPPGVVRQHLLPEEAGCGCPTPQTSRRCEHGTTWF